MVQVRRLGLFFMVFAVALCACAGQGEGPGEEQVVEAAWEALDPNTSSHKQGNWITVAVRQVSGEEVAELFAGEVSAGCWMGPEPPPNEEIDPAGSYWYVEMRPSPATPDPQRSSPSPTAPPAIPEPFLRQALLLVNAQDGRVVARKLLCVIY